MYQNPNTGSPRQTHLNPNLYNGHSTSPIESPMEQGDHSRQSSTHRMNNSIAIGQRVRPNLNMQQVHSNSNVFRNMVYFF